VRTKYVRAVGAKADGLDIEGHFPRGVIARDDSMLSSTVSLKLLRESKEQLMRFIAGVILTVIILFAAGAAYIYSGAFDVAASTPHNAFEQWLLNSAMIRSVMAKSEGISQPPHFTDEMIKDGFDHYDDMCTGCHGGPGIERCEIGKGLNPQAPDLVDAVKFWSPRQLFWIVKHGVKMTGMPSFGKTHDDNEVWSIVAFVEKLPGMSAEQYQQIKQQAGPDTHEHMMQH
jgi:mono/diheme cytochrome c family protein